MDQGSVGQADVLEKNFASDLEHNSVDKADVVEKNFASDVGHNSVDKADVAEKNFASEYLQNKGYEKNMLKPGKQYLKGCAKEYGRETEVAKERDKKVEFEEQDANEHDLELDTKESERETDAAHECDKNVEDEKHDVKKYRGIELEVELEVENGPAQNRGHKLSEMKKDIETRHAQENGMEEKVSKECVVAGERD